VATKRNSKDSFAFSGESPPKRDGYHSSGKSPPASALSNAGVGVGSVVCSLFLSNLFQIQPKFMAKEVLQ